MRRFPLACLIWIAFLPADTGRARSPGRIEEAGAEATSVRVAGIVLKWIRGDKEANLGRLEPMVREAARRGAKIVCTTECFLDGYAIADKSIPLESYRRLGERTPGGEHFERLARLADELDIWLVAGMLEADGETRYNTAVVLTPGGDLAGKYRKQKLGHEHPRNTPGSGSPVFSTPFGTLGVMICADRRERSLVHRLCERGADFLICPSGGMFGPERNDPIVQARSRETGRHIVFVHPAEFLVTGPDGSILERTILGDRLAIGADEAGSEVDTNRVFTFDLPLRRPGTKSVLVLDLESALARPILKEDQPLREVQVYTEARVARLPAFADRPGWNLHAARLRRLVLETVVLRGEAARWRELTTRVEWLERIAGGEGYDIRKLRFEAVPGVWVPALLYEPHGLSGRVPVVLNVNGHDGKGKAAPYKQIRCINQARRGMLALNVEWFGMGQLRNPGFAHYRMNQLDLCGTSGLAPFYLAMRRGLDILLAHDHADPERVAVAGLSGGGWQTITISALDTRVTLANPVAGYGSFRDRANHLPDLGDSEQTPVDLASIADYTHMTALLAPRAALLTYNAEDDCCFRAEHTLPRLLGAARPVYELLGRGGRLRSHINHDPGTHNFERENREVLYSFMGEQFFPGATDYRSDEIPCDREIRTTEDLHVALPDGNGDFHGLALELARDLPRGPELPRERAAAEQWQRERRDRLREILRVPEYGVLPVVVDAANAEGGTTVTRWRLGLGGEWTVPAVEVAPPEATHTRLVLTDTGRAGARDLVGEALGEGARVVTLDPFYFGESRISQRDFLYALLVSSVGDRPLGIQAGQVAAVCRWLRDREDGTAVHLSGRGPRSSLHALVAAALEPEAVESVTVEKTHGSLHEILELDLAVNEAPELFCFGLLEQFDILHIAALVAPRPIHVRSPGERARKELGPLVAWYRTLGRERDPFR